MKNERKSTKKKKSSRKEKAKEQSVWVVCAKK